MVDSNRSESRPAELVVAELYDRVWSRGDYAAIERLVAPRYAIHSDPGDAWEGQSLDRVGYRARAEYSRSAFPDLEFVLHEAIGGEGRVAVRWSAVGTHLGDLRGLPATGKRLTFHGQTLYAMRDGRVGGHWQVIDRLGFAQQLSAILARPGSARTTGEGLPAAPFVGRPRAGAKSASLRVALDMHPRRFRRVRATKLTSA